MHVMKMVQHTVRFASLVSYASAMCEQCDKWLVFRESLSTASGWDGRHHFCRFLTPLLFLLTLSLVDLDTDSTHARHICASKRAALSVTPQSWARPLYSTGSLTF